VTRIDFYILNRPTTDACQIYACRLAEKAVGQNTDVLINVPSAADAARLDELLWTFSQGSFLPHRLLTDTAREDQGERVLIGCGTVPEAGPWDLLINLTDELPEFFSQFQRVAELIGITEDSKAAGRERFRYYRDRGYDLHTHQI
jgi:DNA polymerase-3 subunit chi